MEEMIGQQVDTVVVLTVVVVDAVLVEVEDLHLVVDAVLTVVGIEATEKCLKPHVATAEKNVKYLSGQQTVNLFTAVNVLKKWEMVEEAMPQETILDLRPRLQTKTTFSLMP